MNLRGVPAEYRSSVSDDGRVSLSDRSLLSVPGWVLELDEIVSLDLSHNNLYTLPESFGNLGSLEYLDLSGNRLSDLPTSFKNLKSLKSLDLSGSYRLELPSSLWELTKLEVLILRENRLTSLSDDIRNLRAITTLDLRGNRLSKLPRGMGSLTGLKYLNLRGMGLVGLHSLPEWMKDLVSLETLNLSGNPLSVLPEWINRFIRLKELTVSGGKLAMLPESIGDLSALIELDISQNQITELPSSIGRLTSLQSLNLTSNRLTRLPMQLADPLIKGLYIILDQNPLEDPLPTLIERGADSLATYLRSLEETKAHYEAKMLLVGEGNVGKSSLVAALAGSPFLERRPTTHGIEITPLMFPHPALDQEIMLRAWDFGGQEVYRVTYQFFYSRRAIYVVVWNAREGQEQNEVEDWLRRIRLRVGRDARIIVVATHCEERLPELDYPHLEREFPDVLAGNFEVDNRTALGIPLLREALSVEASKLPQMGQLISSRWLAAREEILNYATSEPQMMYEKFGEICDGHRLTSQETLTLAQLMHDLGQIIYYGEDDGLKDVVVLNPEWLTAAISYVLNNKATRDTGGIISHAHLRHIWENPEAASGYPSIYHPYFLRLMEKFDVSYRLEGDEPQSLIAQLVPLRRPILPWEPRTQPEDGVRTLAMICLLSEPAPGLISWLTVRHHRASTGKHWRRGVFLRHPIPEYHSEALLELVLPGKLAIEVRAPSPDLFFNVIRDSVEELIRTRWPGQSYRLLIPCPHKLTDGSTCPGEFPLDGLLRLRQSGQVEIPCIECTTVHQISLLLTGFADPIQPLSVELEHMRDQLTRMEKGIVRLEGHAAETAYIVRKVLRALSVEVTDCPRLFTIVEDFGARVRDVVRIHESRYRLTLWCEHPGYWHPCEDAIYRLRVPKDWFVQVSPYARLVFRTLQLVVPVAGSLVEALLSPDQLYRVQADMDLMKTLVAALPSNLGPYEIEPELEMTAGRLTAAEGQALRAVRAILFELDPKRAFGGLRRVQAPSGDFLWVCPEHYIQYDPGLPILPTAEPEG